MKVLYGICGIGNGHIFRQLPIATALARQGAEIVVFGYGLSYPFFQEFAKDYPNVSVERVAVPYYLGCAAGLDFTSTPHLEVNQQDFLSINCRAMAQAEKKLGQPDLVITDYEPVCAQYAYAHGAPLVTIDQQSKYLAGRFPEELNGHYYKDEVMRLRMLFPRAAKRIACSFFRVEMIEGEKVSICPSVLRERVRKICRHPRRGSLLVYLSAQQFEKQSLPRLEALFERTRETSFTVFVPKSVRSLPANRCNVTFAYHNDPSFDTALESCEGIISTAGHGLLSEAMHLGIPVLAMPLPLYEQQMNAKVIGEGRFGLVTETLNGDVLKEFVMRLPEFAQNIANDNKVLLRRDGLDAIMSELAGIHDTQNQNGNHKSHSSHQELQRLDCVVR